jgi:hypothetical protein
VPAICLTFFSEWFSFLRLSQRSEQHVRISSFFGVFDFFIASHRRLHKSIAPAEPAQVTISGISAGAFMAAQLFQAFSSMFVGAGLFAGGPYYCAQFNLEIALNACMTSPDLIDLAVLKTEFDFCVDSLTCDAASHMKNSRVWIFSGTNDTVVLPGVVLKQEAWFRQVRCFHYWLRCF